VTGETPLKEPEAFWAPAVEALSTKAGMQRHGEDGNLICREQAIFNAYINDIYPALTHSEAKAGATKLRPNQMEPVDMQDVPDRAGREWLRTRADNLECGGAVHPIFIKTAAVPNGTRPLVAKAMMVMRDMLEQKVDAWEAARRMRSNKGPLCCKSELAITEHRGVCTHARGESACEEESTAQVEEHITTPQQSHETPTELLQYAAAVLRSARDQAKHGTREKPTGRARLASKKDLTTPEADHKLQHRPAEGPEWELMDTEKWRERVLGGAEAVAEIETALEGAHARIEGGHSAAVDGSFHTLKEGPRQKADAKGAGNFCLVLGEHPGGTKGGEASKNKLQTGEFGAAAEGPVNSSTYTETQGAGFLLLIADQRTEKFYQDNTGAISAVARMAKPLSTRQLLNEESSVGGAILIRGAQRRRLEKGAEASLLNPDDTSWGAATFEHVKAHTSEKHPELSTRLNQRAHNGCKAINPEKQGWGIQVGEGTNLASPTKERRKDREETNSGSKDTPHGGQSNYFSHWYQRATRESKGMTHADPSTYWTGQPSWRYRKRSAKHGTTDSEAQRYTEHGPRKTLTKPC
jgi:hypothetical protein